MAGPSGQDDSVNGERCSSCQGRGGKLVRSRRGLVLGGLVEESAPAQERDRLDCAGTGLAAPEQ